MEYNNEIEETGTQIYDRRREQLTKSKTLRRQENANKKFTPLEEIEEVENDEDNEDFDENEEIENEDINNDEPEVKHKIKVNGKELELTYDELIARAQKVESADDYLRNAKISAQAAQELSAPSQQDEPNPQVDEEEIDLAIVDAIQMGDREEALAAIRKIKNKTPSVNKDDIIREIDERTRFQKATSKFNAEYGDLMEDPYMRDIIFTEERRQIESGDTRDYETRFTEIGENIRAWRNSVAKTTAQEDKHERKLNARQAPTTNGGSRANISSGDRAETNEERLERLRNSRRPKSR